MAASDGASGGGVLEVRGEDEGVAGGVEGGDAVVGERVGWLVAGPRVVLTSTLGVRAQRGSADDASAQSITIGHST